MNTNFFRLPFTFDEEALAKDLATCQRLHWQQHFNQKDYSGTWTSISLRSATGRAEDIYAHSANNTFTDTSLLAECSYFRYICDQFLCEKEAIRLLSLAPGSRINEHTDPGTGYPHGMFRVHIPIQTVEAVRFRVAGVDLPMRAGECWYANFHLPHSVQNDGLLERVHLVIDCQRNSWSDEIFRQAGYDFTEEARALDHSPETKRQMLAELSRLDSDAARTLIIQLKQELGEVVKSKRS
ncbi:aspartyl/asparaginyl beta-hydroxylase domain-containing protein [Spirosoma soli]|uniref:Aspartyl/asparaginyl beta-hydroxylase domain-containing protein n=1 Tax=Spirosoma soli TaxID=1770529 RepID=A0ABW5LYD2_9BACT